MGATVPQDDTGQNLTGRTLVGGAWQFSMAVSRAIFQVAVLAVLARYLTAVEFGLVAMAKVPLGFAKMVTEMGLGPALIQKKGLQSGHIHVAFYTSLLLGIIVTALLWFGAPWMTNFFQEPRVLPVLQAVAILALVNSFGVVSSSLLYRAMQFRGLFGIHFTAQFFYAVIGIVLAVLGYGVWAIVIAMFVQSLLVVVFCYWVQPHSIRPTFSSREFMDVFHFGSGQTLAHFFFYGARQGDYIIIQRLLGTAALGLYERAFAIVELPARYLGEVLRQVLFPAMSIVQDQIERLKVAFLRSSSMIYIVLLPLTVFIMVVGEEIVLVLLGDQWIDTVPTLRILSAGIAFRTAVGLADSVIRARGGGL